MRLVQPVKDVLREVEWKTVAELVEAERAKAKDAPKRAWRTVTHRNGPVFAQPPGATTVCHGSWGVRHDCAGRAICCARRVSRGAVLPCALGPGLDRPQVQWKAWDSEYLALAEAMRFQGTHHTRTPHARGPCSAEQIAWRARGVDGGHSPSAAGAVVGV